MKTIDADRLKARIMRLSQGDLKAKWTAAGIVKVIEEEEAAEENASFLPLTNDTGVILW